MYNIVCCVVMSDVVFFLGNTAVTMNVHMLSHLTLYVKAWGPLWTTSCFAFESMNGVLKGHFHGTRDMCIQVNTLWH